MPKILETLSFAAAATFIIAGWSHNADAALIYSNGFESGAQVIPSQLLGQGDGLQAPNGYCNEGGGTGLLQGHKGCALVVPTASIGAGNGNYTAWANPNQTSGGAPVTGSTLSFLSIPLVNGYSGQYEFSFRGQGVRELVFVDQVWHPFGFSMDPESPFGGSIPDNYSSGPSFGTEVTITGNDYLVSFDLDERTRLFEEAFAPGTGADGARFSLCNDFNDPDNCSLRFTFAIDNSGWLDDIELNYLGTGQNPVAVPEPGTAGLLLTGLVAAGTLVRRRGNRPQQDQ